MDIGTLVGRAVPTANAKDGVLGSPYKVPDLLTQNVYQYLDKGVLRQPSLERISWPEILIFYFRYFLQYIVLNDIYVAKPNRRSLPMIVHVLILAITAAILAAFLILWYFWVRKKIELAYALDDEEQVLFPFRYFSWILLAVVLVTCLAQVHFVRVSSTVHENLAVMSDYLKTRQEGLDQVGDLRGMIEQLRTDLDGKFRRLHQETVRPIAVAQAPPVSGGPPGVSAAAKSPERALVMLATKKRPQPQTGFEKAAGASSIGDAPPRIRPSIGPSTNRPPVGSKKESLAPADDKESLSMDLNLMGKVTADLLRVRKRPGAQGSIIDKLHGGQRVKVTEKRLENEAMWYRVITPSGKAGWVDYRYLKLDL